MLERARALLAHRHFPKGAILLALLLTSVTLTMGPMLDDFVMRYAVAEVGPFPGGPRGIWDLYRFADGGAGTRESIDIGLYPWWTSPDLKIGFFRPLSSLVVAFEQTVFPNTPFVWHLLSWLLYGGIVAIAGRLYGKLIGGATAGLALLLYAVDDAHTIPVLWAANRHALFSAAFVFAALVVQVERRSRWLGAGLFALALAAGESAICGAGYLFAYAVFADPRGRRAALVDLVPHAVVLVVWLGLYVGLGYGVDGSIGYVHPIESPVAFTLAMLERAPQLVASQLVGVPGDVWSLVPAERKLHAALVAWAVTIVVGGILWRATRGHRLRTFFGAGAVLSLLPSCATFPSDRMLLLPGFGFLALVAIAVARVGRAAFEGRARISSRVLVGFALFVHVFAAALLFPLRAIQSDRVFSGSVRRGAATIPGDEKTREEQAIVLWAPDPLMSTYAFLEKYVAGGTHFVGVRILTTVDRGTVTISRADDHTLVVDAERGMFTDVFSGVYSNVPFVVGEPRPAGDMVATVLSIDERGSPTSVKFEFAKPLEEAKKRWFVWKDGGFHPVSVPVAGETIQLQAIDWMTAYDP